MIYMYIALILSKEKREKKVITITERKLTILNEINLLAW